MNNQDYELLTIAKQVVRYQVTSIGMLWSTGFVIKFIELEIWIMLFMASFFVSVFT